MHKKIYASGFLYHLPSNQILLQQDITAQNLLSQWFLFGGTCAEKDDPEVIFKHLISDLLHIKIKTVHHVYSYENENMNNYIVYSEVEKLRDFSPKNGIIFNWFPFKNALKLQLSEQTKHDIVVGQRVIDAAGRKDRGEHTFQ